MKPETIAKELLNINAVSLNPKEPFTWSSGLRSPIYCDNRLTMSYPSVRELIADEFAALIKEKYPEAEVIAGTATAGIPHAAWAAERLSLPMVYVRSKAKGHGKGNKIEGTLKAGQKVVVIEDLISTGGSSLQAAAAIEEADGDVLGVCSIFTYEFETAAEAFMEAGIPAHSLTNYSVLLKLALDEKKITEEEYETLAKWSSDPQGWFSKTNTG
ncbi:orotate phosphoribosyltransferase [Evansella sp. LMS18]|uniref:orotate phosphoribosyltransferase n=1 Tax=Evansella sp. LMS18 TaxID=2924033 RepID=UPI0020D02FB9|nr:orotate phosphoribosyltransferase [Evansella sp. LMS18]UTR10942.1 orotate phosphoribosyltransferase [Evansella sp. LMS18]